MQKATYRYTGPNSAVTLKVSDGAGGFKDQDVILWSGQNVELPSDHEVTKALEHQGLLDPISQAQVSAQSPMSAPQADQVAPATAADKSTQPKAK
ncbi:hypothetical protein [Limnohabitans sp. TS-CS-82]|uniref:hypothetical protein n=1 Tax=Limnohabitans sp. TS-CS-82 TaxID=2094193 RepID=UPI00191BF81E|nr:hypothetical protein [Limnohabitans sp. TS-CS-82]